MSLATGSRRVGRRAISQFDRRTCTTRRVPSLHAARGTGRESTSHGRNPCSLASLEGRLNVRVRPEGVFSARVADAGLQGSTSKAAARAKRCCLRSRVLRALPHGSRRRDPADLAPEARNPALQTEINSAIRRTAANLRSILRRARLLETRRDEQVAVGVGRPP